MKKPITFFLKASVMFSLALFCNKSFAQFSQGNLVVLQAGDGVATLTNTGNPILLQEFNPSGAPTFSMAVPSTGTNALVVSGSATSEGVLSLSADGKLLVFAGYTQSLPNATNLTTAASTLINRGIGTVNNMASYSLVATSTSFFSGNNIRSATSDGLNNYWASGANDGTDYFGTASTPINIQNSVLNQRASAIFNNQLYFSSQSAIGPPPGLLGIWSAGSNALPTTTQTPAIFINTGQSSQPVQFYFETSPTPTVCYVADSRTNGNGGVQKWVYSGAMWVLAYTLATGSSTVGANGVVVDFSGQFPMVYATTTEGTTNRLVSILDLNASSTYTTIASSATNTKFRGLAFSPYCAAPVITSATSSGSICANQALNLNVTNTGAQPFTYAWSGTGSFNSTTVSNPQITGASTGNYTVNITNSCGTASAVVSASVAAIPALSANITSSAVCAGGTVAITASGASTYTWSGGISNGGSFIPTTSSSYTVIGTAVNGCTNSFITGAIIVNPLPLVSVNSITLCSGQSGTLTASGASNYTWSNGSNTASTPVTYTINNTYSVTGTSSLGCSSSATAQVSSMPSPTINVSSSASVICVGQSATLTASGAPTYSWTNGPATANYVITPTITTTYSIAASGTNACVSTATFVQNVSACTGIKTTIDQNSIVNLYPNPTSSEINFQFADNAPKTIEIWNILGKKVYSDTTSNTSFVIDGTLFAKGIYSVTIQNNNSITSKKLVIE